MRQRIRMTGAITGSEVAISPMVASIAVVILRKSQALLVISLSRLESYQFVLRQRTRLRFC
jgi:hypothetical protein